MDDFDQDRTPPPWRRPVEISPSSQVSMPLWKFLAFAIAIGSTAVSFALAYSGIQHSIQSLQDRLVSMDAKLSQSDPAKTKDLVNAAIASALKKPIVVECPKHVIKGEAVARCLMVVPKDDDR